MTAEQQVNQWGQIVAKAWQDDKFKKRLVAEPAAIFKEFGLEVLPGVQLRVVENTDKLVHLTLPARAPETELSDAELEGVAGGFGSWAGVAMALAMHQPGGPLGDRCVRTTLKTGDVEVSCETDPHLYE